MYEDFNKQLAPDVISDSLRSRKIALGILSFIASATLTTVAFIVSDRPATPHQPAAKSLVSKKTPAPTTP